MKYFILMLVWAAFSAQTVLAGDGLVHIKSAHDVKTTADRLEKVLEAKGMTLFNRIDHAAGAKSVGRQLRPTELVIFGNPKVGSPLMACRQTVGIDLPQKALIWQDEAGQTWFSYNRPAYLKSRHHIEGCDDVLGKVSKALENFAKAATQP
jgi:uncharacterized protein (DUF302 family)